MRLTFPIGYDLKGRRPGKRVFRPYRFSEMASVDIPEVHAYDAPIAVEWKVPLGKVSEYEDRELDCCDENRRQFTRWYDGRHWLRLVEGHASAPGTDQGPADFTHEIARKRLSEGHGHSAIGLGRFPPGWFGHITRAHEDPTSGFAEVRSSGRQAAMLAVDEVPNTVICVDGVLHAACAQPALRMTASFGEVTQRLYDLRVDTREEVVDGWLGFTRHHLSYSLGSWERLAPKAGVTETGAPVVHLPESIDPDIDNRRSADRLVKKAAFEFGYPLELGEELRSYFDDMDISRVTKLAGIVERYGASWNLDRGEYARIARALERLEDKLSISFDVSAVRGYGM